MGGVVQYVQHGVLAALAGGEGYVRAERWRNEKKYNAERPAIGEIVKARVTRTVDSNEQVISLESVDGRKVSLWLRYDGTVRSITNY